MRSTTPFSPATWSASASTPATRCAAIGSDRPRERAAPSSCSAAFTRRCSRTKCASTAARTPWSPATATSSGQRSSTTAIRGTPQPLYAGGRVDGDSFSPARWDLLPTDRYMWASVQTVRGCPKHCSFCSVWRTDGQKPRQRDVSLVVREIVAASPPGFPLHRARRRQLLSGDAGRSRRGRSAHATRRQHASLTRAPRRNASS